MTENTRRSIAPCANEACARPAEEDEVYCATCGLERSLYRRDSRHAGEQDWTEIPTEPAGR